MNSSGWKYIHIYTHTVTESNFRCVFVEEGARGRGAGPCAEDRS